MRLSNLVLKKAPGFSTTKCSAKAPALLTSRRPGGSGPESSYDTTTINFGAALSRHDIHVTMDHEGAECWVDGLYMVTAASTPTRIR